MVVGEAIKPTKLRKTGVGEHEQPFQVLLAFATFEELLVEHLVLLGLVVVAGLETADLLLEHVLAVDQFLTLLADDVSLQSSTYDLLVVFLLQRVLQLRDLVQL